jgi:carboxymethylenebutenolidase
MSAPSTGSTSGPTPESAPAAREVTLPGVDGDLRGILVRPAGPGDRPTPVVVVVPEVDGLTSDTEVAAGRLAGAGYTALAVDLYTPLGGVPKLRNPTDTIAFTQRLNDHRQLSDLSMALSWLQDQDGVDPDRVGLVGFSAGGRYSLLLSTEPRPVRAVVTFYTRIWPSELIGGRPVPPGDHTARFRAPVCSIFGAQDDVVPPEMVDRYRRLLAARSGHEVHLVDGNHLFMNPSRRRYVPQSAERAWSYALDFLARHLGS